VKVDLLVVYLVAEMDFLMEKWLVDEKVEWLAVMSVVKKGMY
jgi:hypothetical protein